MPRTCVPARALRGSVVAAVGLGVAVAGHAHAGGAAGIGPLAVLAAVLSLAGCVLISRQQWTAGRLLVALVAMQVVAHGALWLGGGAQQADARLAALATPASGHAHATAGDALSARMLLAHLAAMGVAAVLLAGLDTALVLLAALARRLRPAAPVAVPALPPRRPRAAAAGLPVWALERGPVVRRGPPGRLAPR